MKEDLIDIVMTKEFVELTESERHDFTEWFTTQEEFEQMKQVFLEVERIKTKDRFVPRQATKDSLDALFASKHSKTAPTIWYNSVLVALYPKEKPAFQRPLLQVAAIVVLLLLVYPFLNTMKVKDEPVQMSRTESVHESKTNESADNVDPVVPTPAETKVVESPVLVAQETPILMDVESVTEMSVSEERLAEAEDVSTFSSAAIAHPDGIFTGVSAVTYSQSAAKQPAIFDLLTATF